MLCVIFLIYPKVITSFCENMKHEERMAFIIIGCSFYYRIYKSLVNYIDTASKSFWFIDCKFGVLFCYAKKLFTYSSRSIGSPCLTTHLPSFFFLFKNIFYITSMSLVPGLKMPSCTSVDRYFESKMRSYSMLIGTILISYWNFLRPR